MKGFKSATMLYRKGTQDRLHGVHVDTCVVDEHQVEEALDDGWHRSPDDVKKATESERLEFEAREKRRAAERAEQDRIDREAAEQLDNEQRAIAAHAAAERIAAARAEQDKPAAIEKKPAAAKA
jgi:hypothetical protein